MMLNENKKVWIIDEEQWPRACLRAELIERGFDAEGFVYLSEAFGFLKSARHEKPDLIILVVRSQNLTASDIEMLSDTQIPVILIGGQHELQQSVLQKLKHAHAFMRPVTLGEIATKTEELLKE